MHPFEGFFPHNSNVKMQLIDALSSNLNAKSPVELSLTEAYKESYSTISKAVKFLHCKRDIDVKATIELQNKQKDTVTNHLCEHLPINQHHHLLAVDVTSVSRPYADKLTDKGYVHANEPIAGKKPITRGHEYSCLGYLPDCADGWLLPLRTDRVPTSENGVLFGMRQVRQIKPQLDKKNSQLPCVIVADAAYSCKAALHENHSHDTILIARLRGNRKLLRPAAKKTAYKTRKHWYDQENPFRLNDSTSWGEPAKQVQIEWNTRGGKRHHVDIQLWSDLRVSSDKGHDMHTISLSVVRIAVTKSDKTALYKHPLWLVIEGDWQARLSLKMIWNDYRSRFDIEHFFRYAKPHLLLNHYQTPDTTTEENWMQIVMLSHHQLFHARDAAQFCPNPWERSKRRTQKLTPRFVQRDMSRLLPMAKPTSTEVKSRGIGTGRRAGLEWVKRPKSETINKTKNKQQENKSTFVKKPDSAKVDLSLPVPSLNFPFSILHSYSKQNSTGPPV